MDASLGQQRIGEQRFDSGIEYEKQLLRLTRVIQDRLISGLPSNYSRDRNTNLAEFFMAVAKEFARLQIDSSNINENKYHNETKTEYLWQVLGDTLFLGDKAINENLTDAKYRAFLLRVRDAYYGGSRPKNIESAVSDIIGLPVTLRELYLEARKECSSYGLKDTHRMFFDILMDGVDSTSSIGLILEDLKFFIDILKPAHVQYDTRLVWTDEARVREQACTPDYDLFGYSGVAYGAEKIHMVTWLASSVYGISGSGPSSIHQEGVVSSVDLDRGIIHMDDDRLMVYTAATKFYTGSDNVSIRPENLSTGDVVKYYAVKDSEKTSDVIDDTWGYTGIVSFVDESSEVIGLEDGSTISYGNQLLVYTRDGAGEYRIDVTDLLPGKEIAFKGTRYDHLQHRFYRTPVQVMNNPYKQFDEQVITRPYFQENVVKKLEYPPGMTAGPNIAIIDGIATVVDVRPKFYGRRGEKKYRSRKIDRYSLSINGTYTAQFSITDPERTLTKEESKQTFIALGYTGINDPSVSYNVSVSHTGDLVEDGSAAEIAAINDATQTCERAASCQLAPYYEDLRRYWVWPDVNLVSGFFLIAVDFPDVLGVSGALDVPAWFQVSSDPNEYNMPYLPMLGPSGLPATVSDITIYVDGLKVEDAVVYVDPWTGIVGLNFIPPFDVTLRVDYWHSDRYPSRQSHFVEVASLPPSVPGDVAAGMTVLSTTGVSTRLCWPFEVTDPSLHGDDRDYQVNKFPILNQRGELATPADVIVSIGNTVISGNTEIVEYQDGNTVLGAMGADWSSVEEGDTILLQVENYLDRSLVFTVLSVNALSGTLVVPGSLPPLATTYPYKVIRFSVVDNAVTAVRPLLGHVRVNFLAPAGTVVKFDYYYTPKRREYLMYPDFCGDTGADFYGASQYTADTYYGSQHGYGMVVDYAFTGAELPRMPFDQLLKYGYRYRAFDLTSSSVLNSETLVLNGYTTPSKRASFAGSGNTLNDAHLVFSPEHLTDTSKNVVLNDLYLRRDLEAYTRLNPGVPPFIKTQTDDGHYRLFRTADEQPSYDPYLDGGRDLHGSFSIIDPDNSGIIDRNGVCDMATNERVSLYSDLKMVRSSNGGYDAPLSTIDDASGSWPFKTCMVERYYPNREQRVSDYLDYINQVPSEYKHGSLYFMRGSVVAKSDSTNLLGMRVGDILLVKNVPYEYFSHVSHEWETRYKDIQYVVVDVVDAETVRINTPFDGLRGKYDYDLTRDVVYNVDVRLNEVTRSLNLGATGFDYGITGTGLNWISFHDPDPDPYPRSPDNPNIRHPYVSYYPIGDVTGPDGVLYRTNRILGVTGWVLTSDIIDRDGNSFGFTGPFSYGLTGYYVTGSFGVTGPFYTGIEGGNSGFTGPSGALNLGITGPVEYANPRTVDDYDVYKVPGGYTGDFFSYSEAEYRVQWRNWDQGICIARISEPGLTGTLAGLTGIVVVTI